MNQISIIFICIVLGMLLPAVSFSQRSGKDEDFKKRTSVILGYDWNTDLKTNNSFHMLELGLVKSKYKSRIPVNFSYYFSNEFVLNANKFVWGPKVGVNAGLFGLIVGAETIYYTDFEKGSLRIGPYMGFGNHIFKLTLIPQITLANKNFGINNYNLNLTFNIFDLNKKKKCDTCPAFE